VAIPVEDEPPIEVLLDIDAEFEDCKPTGKTGLSFYSSVLVAAKTLTLTGKKLAEYWVNRYAAIAKVRLSPSRPLHTRTCSHDYNSLRHHPGRRHRQRRPATIPSDTQDRSR
jgi:hypothetical protein